MKTKTKMNAVLAVAGLLLIAGIGRAGYIYWQFREPLHAKETEERMVSLMGVLNAEQPDGVDLDYLQPLLAKYNRLDCREDGWGRAFVIERGVQAGNPHYIIISLGRDGRRGSCCKKWVADWDDDAVLSDDEWLQIWYPKAVRAQRARSKVGEAR